MSFWSLQKVSTSLSLGSPASDRMISKITTDSRAVGPDCLFVAIRGDTHDGHDFISQAIEKGAAAILSEKPIPSAPASVHIFQVPSTLTAIRTLAHHYRKTFSIPFIGIVGAVGKTTTKEFTAALLRGKFKSVLKTEGSENGFLGIALTLLKLEPTHEIAVIEIGIDEIGAMDQHLQLVEPTHLVLTPLGPEHLHQLKTTEIAAEEELKAFDYGVRNGTLLAINLSDPYVIQWHQKNKDRLAPKQARTYDFKKNSVYASIQNPLEGEHNDLNLLAALTICSFFNLSATEIEKGLLTFRSAAGRSEIYHLGNQTIIGDYYNSNPTSANAALVLLSQLKASASPSKLHAVLGDMLELGDHEEVFHRELSNSILKLKIDQVWLFGPRMKWLLKELKSKEFHSVQHFSSHSDLLNALKGDLGKNDRVLIKGSRGMKMENVLNPLLQKTGLDSYA